MIFGVGLGMFITALLLMGSGKQSLTKSEIEKRAAALGMGYREQFLLFPSPSDSPAPVISGKGEPAGVLPAPGGAPGVSPEAQAAAASPPAAATGLAPPGENALERQVTISPGSHLEQVATTLKQAGVIPDEAAFVAEVQRLGFSSKLQAGEYRFKPGIEVAAVIGRLVQGPDRVR